MRRCSALRSAGDAVPFADAAREGEGRWGGGADGLSTRRLRVPGRPATALALSRGGGRERTNSNGRVPDPDARAAREAVERLAAPEPHRALRRVLAASPRARPLAERRQRPGGLRAEAHCPACGRRARR